MFGAVAAGKGLGGYDSIYDAAKVMAHLKDEVYVPIRKIKKYMKSYMLEYVILHDYFGRGANDVMKRLKNYQSRCKEVKNYARETKRGIGAIASGITQE